MLPVKYIEGILGGGANFENRLQPGSTLEHMVGFQSTGTLRNTLELAEFKTFYLHLLVY